MSYVKRAIENSRPDIFGPRIRPRMSEEELAQGADEELFMARLEDSDNVEELLKLAGELTDPNGEGPIVHRWMKPLYPQDERLIRLLIERYTGSEEGFIRWDCDDFVWLKIPRAVRRKSYGNESKHSEA